MIHALLTTVLLLSAFGVIFSKKPISSCCCFLITLISLSGAYFDLSAPFVSVMQILVYAGAILVLFVFVLLLFQGAREKITSSLGGSCHFLIGTTALLFLLSMALGAYQVLPSPFAPQDIERSFGSAEAIGQSLYTTFFFPFEAAGLLLLVALVGASFIQSSSEHRGGS